MKDKDTSAKSDRRLAKATAAIREEHTEDVVPYQHNGGHVGKSIRLKRMHPSAVSGDAAQPAPSIPLPVSTGNQRHRPQPGSILHQFQNLPAHERMKQAVHEVRKSPSAKTTQHITLVAVPGTSGKHGLCSVVHNLSEKSPPKDKQNALEAYTQEFRDFYKFPASDANTASKKQKNTMSTLSTTDALAFMAQSHVSLQTCEVLSAIVHFFHSSGHQTRPACQRRYTLTPL